MAKPSKPLVLGFILAVLIACAATLTMYAMQQKPAPPAATGTDACNCRDSGITGGVQILRCTCTLREFGLPRREECVDRRRARGRQLQMKKTVA